MRFPRATAAGTPGPLRHGHVLQRADRLIPRGAARSSATAPTPAPLAREGHMPAGSPPAASGRRTGARRAVLASARPKQAGSIEQIARDWFAAHAPEAVA